jgi:hypothetical protein
MLFLVFSSVVVDGLNERQKSDFFFFSFVPFILWDSLFVLFSPNP